jgi:hypothetical protein
MRNLLTTLLTVAVVTTAQAETIPLPRPADRLVTVEASGNADASKPATTWLTLPTAPINDQWPEVPTLVTFWHLPNGAIYGSPDWMFILQELKHVAVISLGMFPGYRPATFEE